MMYDTLLLNGQVMDPCEHLEGIMDIAIKDGKIVAIEPHIDVGLAKNIIQARDHLVLPGLIDTHAHVFDLVTGRFGVDADLSGVYSGVTTLIDQGGPSCITLPAFRRHVVEAKKSKVVAFLSSYLVGGLEGHYYPSTASMWMPPSRAPWPTQTLSKALKPMLNWVGLPDGE